MVMTIVSENVKSVVCTADSVSSILVIICSTFPTIRIFCSSNCQIDVEKILQAKKLRSDNAFFLLHPCNCNACVVMCRY